MWAKVDDKLCTHPKFVGLPLAPRGLWVTALSWSCLQKTDGFIPMSALRIFGAQLRDARRLVDARMWDETEDGWCFHDWDKYQPSRREIEQRSQDVARKRQHAGSLGGSKKASNRAKPSSKREANVKQTCSPEPDNYSLRGSGAVQDSLVAAPDGVADAPRELQESTGKTPAQQLLAEWLDHCDVRPPGQVINRTGKELKALVDEGFTVDQIRPGLQRWSLKGLSPAALAGVVNECLNAHPERAQRQQLKEVEYFT